MLVQNVSCNHFELVCCGSWFQANFRLLDVVLQLQNVKEFPAAEIMLKTEVAGDI